jgi:hypothetical protein
MVEQVGSIFFECEAGYLHAPGFADLIVRDPITLKPSGMGSGSSLDFAPPRLPTIEYAGPQDL